MTVDNQNKITDQTIGFESSWDTVPLRAVSEIRPSNIDKKSSDEERCVKLCNYTDVYYNSCITSDLEFMEATATEANAERFRLQEGDILLTKDSESKDEIGIAAYVPKDLDDVVCGYHLYLLRPNQDLVDPKYLYHSITSQVARSQFENRAKGVTRFGLSLVDVTNIRIPLPEREIQKKIAKFLDDSVPAIQDTISRLDRLSDTIDDREQSLIPELLSNCDTKEVKLKHLSELLPGYAFSSDGFSDDESGMRLLRGKNISPNGINWEDTEYWGKSSAEFTDYLLEPGDVVLAMDRPWISNGIRVAQMGEEDCPALLVQRVLRIRTNDSTLQSIIMMQLRSSRFQQYFDPILTGVSVPHISKSQVGDFKIKVPAEGASDKIVDEWDNNQRWRDISSEVIENLKGALKERRTALVTKAVCGQIDSSTLQKTKIDQI